MGAVVDISRETRLKQKIAAIVRDPEGELLDKLVAIGALVGVPPPPEHVSPISMGDDLVPGRVEAPLS